MSETSNDYQGQRLDCFRPTGLDRGRPRHIELLWYFVKVFFFLSSWPWPNSLKRRLLVAFGAKVGKGLYLRPRVNIHFPWKLTLGDYCWIGDDCVILNLEPVVFEDHVALAHEVYLAAGSHNIRSRSLAYANKPITIRRGCWIATRAFIGPGVTIGENCVVGAGAIVLKSVPDNSIVGSNVAQVIGTRELTVD
jgi:putative colanic acid biosynthesis acetyltransferase WcaF